MLDRLFRHADDESIKAAIKNARHSSSVTKMIKQGMGYTLLPLQYAQYTGKDEFNILEDEYNIVEISPAVNVNLNCVFSSSFYSHPTGREFINFFI